MLRRRFLYLKNLSVEDPRVDTLTDAAFRAWIWSLTNFALSDRTFAVEDIAEFLFDRPQSPDAVTAELVANDLWEPTQYAGVFQVVATDLWRRGPLATNRPKVRQTVRDTVYTRDGHRCVRCGALTDLTLDHVWPFSLGGQDSVENLQTMCRPCNSRKGART